VWEVDTEGEVGGLAWSTDGRSLSELANVRAALVTTHTTDKHGWSLRLFTQASISTRWVCRTGSTLTSGVNVGC
jgi:hypothetical protein